MKVMVVDDEELVREKLVYLLINSSVEFACLMEAGNGQEALSLMENDQRPDLILTDVRMPVMNGLELIERVRGLYPDIRFIVVSGHAEFEYAVKAMQFGVTSYVLKPVKALELYPIVEKMREEIAKAEREKETIKQTETVKRENERMAAENVLFHWLTNRQDDPALKRSLEEESGILGFRAYVVAAGKLHPDRLPVERDVWAEMRRFVEKHSEQSRMMENFFGKDTFMILFGGENGSLLAEAAARKAAALHGLLRDEFQLAATIGISQASGDLRTAYRSGVTALKNRFLFGAGRIYFSHSGVSPKDNASRSFLFKVKLTEQSLENKSMAKAASLLRQFAEEVFIDRIADYLGETSIDYLFNEYMNMIIRFCLKNDVAFMDRIEPDVLSGKALESLDDNRSVAYLIRTTIDTIFLDAANGDSDQGESQALRMSVIDQIVSYLHRNVQEEVTLQSVAEKFAINPSYLSRVFKAATDQGFVKYLTGLKIGKAKELLQNGTMEIADIAHGLGFSDQQYFNRVFKKTTGMTPNEWRSRTGR